MRKLILNDQEFNENLSRCTKEADDIIKAYLPREEGYQKTLMEAVNYSMEAGGKRIRPILLREAYRFFKREGEEVCYPLMAALEMIHTYSLVHDDLPVMDDDEYRRGRKTTHVVFGEAMAVLAGDALLNLAYETGLTVLNVNDAALLERGARALLVLSKKAGAKGMIGGQSADILAEEGKISHSEELLYFIHEHKTAALIESGMMIGGILAGADEESIKKLEKAAFNIGIAFQIQDDILDVTGSFDELGKPIGSDAANQKLTSVVLKGLEAAKAEVAELSKEAIEILNSFPYKNDFLNQLVESLIYRKK